MNEFIETQVKYVLFRAALGHVLVGPLGTGLWIISTLLPKMEIHQGYKITNDWLDTFLLFALVSALGTLYSLFFLTETSLSWGTQALGILLFTGSVIGFQEVIGTTSKREVLAHKTATDWISGVLVFGFTALLINVAWWLLLRQRPGKAPMPPSPPASRVVWEPTGGGVYLLPQAL